MVPRQRPIANASASDSVRPTVPRMSYSRSVVGSNRWVNVISAQLHVMFQEATHRIGQIGALQRVGDLRRQEADLIAAIEPLAFVAQPMEQPCADQLGHTIGQL